MFRVLARARHFLRQVYRRSPVFDLGGGFFVIAVKEGSSEIPHLDHNDSKYKHDDWIAGISEAPS